VDRSLRGCNAPLVEPQRHAVALCQRTDPVQQRPGFPSRAVVVGADAIDQTLRRTERLDTRFVALVCGSAQRGLVDQRHAWAILPEQRAVMSDVALVEI